jgi:hypothetical protein
MLEMLGLVKSRMVEWDTLFFHQLLLPMCNPRWAGIEGDPHSPSFCSNMENFSNLYALQIAFGGACGHLFKMLKLDELVHFDGVIIQDGVRGSRKLFTGDG